MFEFALSLAADNVCADAIGFCDETFITDLFVLINDSAVNFFISCCLLMASCVAVTRGSPSAADVKLVSSTDLTSELFADSVLAGSTVITSTRKGFVVGMSEATDFVVAESVVGVSGVSELAASSVPDFAGLVFAVPVSGS